MQHLQFLECSEALSAKRGLGALDRANLPEFQPSSLQGFERCPLLEWTIPRPPVDNPRAFSRRYRQEALKALYRMWTRMYLLLICQVTCHFSSGDAETQAVNVQCGSACICRALSLLWQWDACHTESFRDVAFLGIASPLPNLAPTLFALVAAWCSCALRPVPRGNCKASMWRNVSTALHPKV